MFFVVAVLPFTPQYTQQRTIPSWRARMQNMLQPLTAGGSRSQVFDLFSSVVLSRSQRCLRRFLRDAASLLRAYRFACGGAWRSFGRRRPIREGPRTA